MRRTSFGSRGTRQFLSRHRRIKVGGDFVRRARWLACQLAKFVIGRRRRSYRIRIWWRRASSRCRLPSGRRRAREEGISQPTRGTVRSVMGVTNGRMTAVSAKTGRLHGIVVVDKPAGWTSHDVVAGMRRLLGERRIGHAGTLDPAATGVLPIAVGDATKVVEYLSDASK